MTQRTDRPALDLDAIKARMAGHAVMPFHPGSYFTATDSADDVPPLVAEVERLRAENARQSDMLGKVGAVHNGCPNTQDNVVCPWCRIAELEQDGGEPGA